MPHLLFWAKNNNNNNPQRLAMGFGQYRPFAFQSCSMHEAWCMYEAMFSNMMQSGKSIARWAERRKLICQILSYVTKLKPLASQRLWYSSVSKSQKARDSWGGGVVVTSLAFLSAQDCAQRTNSLPAAAVRHRVWVELKYSTTIIGSGGGRLDL